MRSSCARCEELARAQERIAELEDALGLTAQMPARLFPRGLIKSRHHRYLEPLLKMLMKRTVVPTAVAHGLLYGDRPDCDQPSFHAVTAWMHHLRRAMEPHGIELRTVRGENRTGCYYLDDDNKRKLRELIASMEAA
jgi:hypothetical protein